MDPKALFNISYGIFMLSSRSNDGKVNGCITNTCIQVASNPTRVAIACINGNLTCDMVKESGIFCLSILDQSCKFDTIKRFGLQSGRDVDKFADLTTIAQGKFGFPCKLFSRGLSSVLMRKTRSRAGNVGRLE